MWARFRAPLVVVFAASFASFYQIDAILAEWLGTLLLGPTIRITQGLLALAGEQLEPVGLGADGFPLFRFQEFTGELQSACSGYEGILLTIVFLIVRFWQERHRMSPPLFVLVVAVAAATTFLLNALHIAALFVVGARFSAEVAQNGFHTNFGVLSLAVSVGGAYLILDRILNKGPSAVNVIEADPSVRMLYPIIFLTGSSLVLGLFTGKFYWLYPLQCAAGAAGVYLASRRQSFDMRLHRAPVAIGCIVFLFWIAIVPTGPDQDVLFRQELFSASPLVSGLWLLFRFMGAVVVVPIAEEFAFRGAFWSVLSAAVPSHFGRQGRAFVVLIITSVAFGLLHSAVYAGILAGAAFGLARLRSGRVEDAIVAHAAANFLLSTYVLIMGNWSYW